MRADVIPNENIDMTLPTVYLALEKPSDADVSPESYVDAEYVNFTDVRHSIF